MDKSTTHDQGTTSQVSAVIFDYGGVLMRTVNPVPRRELEQRLGLRPGGVYEAVFGNPLRAEVESGRIGDAEFWADVGHRLGLEARELDEFRQAFESGDRLDQDLVALIRHLRQAGYRTALLSNAPTSLPCRIEELGIADAFDVVMTSGQEGVTKPDAVIFERALDRLDVRPEQALFVDDFRENVAGAREVGMQTIHFSGPAPLRRELRALGLPVLDPPLQAVPDVQAVIFDWGGVLERLTDDDHVVAWERRLALEAGTLAFALWGEAWRDLSIGAIDGEEYHRRVTGLLGFPDLETTERFIEQFYAADRLQPEVVEVVRSLRNHHGYQVALLSNAFPGQDEVVLEQYGLDLYAEFDVYVNSADVGLVKPDPDIFYLTLEQLDVAPQRAIFLDDMLRNVDAARELGLHAIQFVTPETSLVELEALLGHTVERNDADDTRI
ncbi:MAG TPA: HAD family phosphatase [Chloroflexi bacterium]|nr:HAD family phosphatase [Chloroflexota bacterium]